MNTYISMLRGINVSGQKRIIMADLRTLYEALDFHNVVSYIQSGNVLFDTADVNIEELEVRIADSIESHFNFKVPVAIRSVKAFSEIIKDYPFQPIDVERDGSKIAVTFLSTSPGKRESESIQEWVVAPEQLNVHGQEIYLHCPNGFGRTKLTNKFIEKKLGVTGTSRNWKTVLKLYELSLSR